MALEPQNLSKSALTGVNVSISDGLHIQPPPPPKPSRFAVFTMESFGISNTRSRHTDTDYVYLSATVGGNPPIFVSKSMGSLNNGHYPTDLSIEVDLPDDDTVVVFNYLIINSGHMSDGDRQKVAQAALSTIAEEIISHKAVSAASIAVLGIACPIILSCVAAVAAVLALVEVGLLLFADCDGVVAAGAIPFTSSDLISKTSSGQLLPQNADHPGNDSPDGCFGNSHYTTQCTITTAPKIETVLDVSGDWATGGVPGPFATVTGNSISIDMSATHRPTATGRVLDTKTISVNFPDDKTYTGVLQAPNTIKWSNNSTWTKVAAIQTVFDLNGQWMTGGVLGPVFTVHGNSIAVDMSAVKRPSATGKVQSGSEISVSFPDDKTYTGVLQAPGTIRWSNNSTWSKFDTSGIKHLFVLMMENRSFDHMLGFQGIKGTDAHTGAPTKAEDLTGPAGADYSNVFDGMKYTVLPTAGDRTYKTNDVQHQFLDVMAQLCGQAEATSVKNNGGLKGAAYPATADASNTGFAADYATNSDATNPGEPMRCFAPGELPVLTALANEFVLCDHWFSAMAGPTEPNRMFAHAATSDVWDDSPTNSDYIEIFGEKTIDITSAGIKFPKGTIFDALRKANIPFRIYTGDGHPQVGLLSGISIKDDIEDFANFVGDLDEPTYDAAYTFIEPAYGTIESTIKAPYFNNSQHPANGVALGEALIKSVYEAIKNSPRWGQSMLIITWDEHGGFFDHVKPPRAAPIPKGSPPKNTVGKDHGYIFDQYGPRVPALVISPLCPPNLIEHRQLEHSFIPATIEQLFGLNPLTNRDAGVVGLQTLATLKTPRLVTVIVPDAKAAAEPQGPLPGTPVSRKIPPVIVAEPILGKVLTSRAVGTGSGATPPAATAGSSAPLNLDDPWLASALAVAMKSHIEASPADADAIRSRTSGLKTVADLAQYMNEMTPIVQKARTEARQKRVSARFQATANIGVIQTAQRTELAQAVDKPA